MDSVSPVWTEAEVETEVVVALDQPQYVPIVVLPVTFSDGVVGLSCRFRLTDKERALIADGADLVVTQLTHQFVPTHFSVIKPGAKPFDDGSSKEPGTPA